MIFFNCDYLILLQYRIYFEICALKIYLEKLSFSYFFKFLFLNNSLDPYELK